LHLLAHAQFDLEVGVQRLELRQRARQQPHGLKSCAIDAGQITSSDAQELRNDRNLAVQAPPEAIKNVLLIQTRDPLRKNQKLRQAIAASLVVQLLVAAGPGPEL
jgi:hypothetical protein